MTPEPLVSSAQASPAKRDKHDRALGREWNNSFPGPFSRGPIFVTPFGSRQKPEEKTCKSTWKKQRDMNSLESRAE